MNHLRCSVEQIAEDVLTRVFRISLQHALRGPAALHNTLQRHSAGSLSVAQDEEPPSRCETGGEWKSTPGFPGYYWIHVPSFATEVTRGEVCNHYAVRTPFVCGPSATSQERYLVCMLPVIGRHQSSVKLVQHRILWGYYQRDTLLSVL